MISHSDPQESSICNTLVGIVIPALNEEGTIRKIVEESRSRGVVVVVNDGSNDDTEKLATDAGADVVSHEFTRGYDEAIASGMQRARALGCQIIITLDADGQHDPSLIDVFVSEVAKGNDLVLGRRDRTQRWAESLFCLVAKTAWGISDPLCGLKAYRLNALEGIGSRASSSSVGSGLAIYLVERKATFSEIPIKTRDRSGPSRFGDGLKPNLRILIALYRTLHYIFKQRIHRKIRPLSDSK